MTTEQLVEELQRAIGPQLKSVVLYGSAAAGDHVAGVSGIDVLIVSQQLRGAELAALAGPLARWHQAGNPLPQLFTAEELAASADVFPIELLDMQQARRVLFGDDPLAEFKIDRQYFRLQLERELKTRLLLLRRRFLACELQPERIAQLLVASVSTFLVLFRACLRLYDESPPAAKADALRSLAGRLEFDPRPFEAVLELKEKKSQPLPAAMEKLFGEYLVSVESVVRAVDRHLHEPRS
jgi:hypothetical protein